MIADPRLLGRVEGLATNATFARTVDRLTSVESLTRRVLTFGAAGSVHFHSDGVHDGPVILLLNGWTASGLTWSSEFLRPLEERHCVVRIDNRGTGWSRDARVPFTIGDLADDAAHVLDTVGADSATVVGLSMGGMVAQELALRHPERIERLVLVATRPPAPAQIPPRPGAIEATFAPVVDPVDVHLRALWASFCGPGFADRHPDRMDELMGQILVRVTPRFAVRAQARAIAGWSGPDRLRRIAAPTTVVHGSVDPLMPVGNGMRLARLIPHARYVELPGVGHIVPMEAPEMLAEVVL